MIRLLPILLIASAFVPTTANAQKVVSRVDCAKLTTRQAYNVQEQICASPELLRQTNEIDEMSKLLETRLTGADKEALVDTEKPYLIQRNNCQNQGSPDAVGFLDRVRTCVASVLLQRHHALTVASDSPASIHSEITAYGFIDPAFFAKYGDELVGRQVQIFGCMDLLPGTTLASRTHAVLRGSCEDLSGPTVPVTFESMTGLSAGFLDGGKPTGPFGWFSGTVEKRDNTLVLYSTQQIVVELPLQY